MEQRIDPYEEERKIADAGYARLIREIIASRDPESQVAKLLVTTLAAALSEHSRIRTAQPPEKYRPLREIFSEELATQLNGREIELEAITEVIRSSAEAGMKGALLKQSVKDERETREAAGIDQLTQVYNRQKIDQILEGWLTSSREEDKNREFAVVIIDLDGFKKVNDTFGHTMGDEILKKFAALLKNHFRADEDFVGRWGGEEFITLIQAPEAKIQKILEDLKFKLQRPFDTDPPLVVTGSIGWTMRRSGSKETSNNLFETADSALYVAKNGGKNRIVKYEVGGIQPEKSKFSGLKNLLQNARKMLRGLLP